MKKVRIEFEVSEAAARRIKSEAYGDYVRFKINTATYPKGELVVSGHVELRREFKVTSRTDIHNPAITIEE